MQSELGSILSFPHGPVGIPIPYDRETALNYTYRLRWCGHYGAHVNEPEMHEDPYLYYIKIMRPIVITKHQAIELSSRGLIRHVEHFPSKNSSIMIDTSFRCYVVV